MKKTLSNKKGFTLIEMILVIVIIAILAAIAIPSLMGYQRDARRTAAEANCRTAYSALAAAQAKAEPQPADAVGIPITPSTATPASPPILFADRAASLLGTSFPGQILCTIDGGAITSVTWNRDAGGNGQHFATFDVITATFTYGTDLQ